MEQQTQVGVGWKSSDYGTKSGITLRRVNTLVTDYDSYLNASLYDVIGTRASPRDSRVVKLVKKLLDPPSDQMIKLARRVIKTPQAETVVKILNGKVGYIYPIKIEKSEHLIYQMYILCGAVLFSRDQGSSR